MPSPNSMFHTACAEGDLHAMTQALAAGANVNSFNPDGLCALHIAAAAGNLPMLQLLTAGAWLQPTAEGVRPWALDIDRGRESDGCSALYCALEEGSGAEVVEALLRAGASSGAANMDGSQPLHCTASMGDLQYTQTLIQYGAEVNSRNQMGQTPLLLAAEAFGTTWVGRSSDYTAVMRCLMDAGAAPDTADPCGDTALHLAVRKGAAEAVRALCAAGANVNTKAGRLSGQCTALHLACAMGDAASIVSLLGAGADLGATEGEAGMTPLHLAVHAGQREAVQLLLEAGADPLLRCSPGLTCVQLAAQGGLSEVQALLTAAAAAAPAAAAAGVEPSTTSSSSSPNTPPEAGSMAQIPAHAAPATASPSAREDLAGGPPPAGGAGPDIRVQQQEDEQQTSPPAPVGQLQAEALQLAGMKLA